MWVSGCHALISSGNECLSTCGFLLAELSCLKPIVAQSVGAKYTTWGQNGQFRGIPQPLGPLRPIKKLQGEATSSPRRASCFWRKQPVRLGELCCNLLPHFDINRREGMKGKGSTSLVSIFH